MWLSVFSISIGAALGAILRWVLSERLNHVFPFLPPGTLTANLVGGYLIGVALMVFASLPNLSVEWRLFVITGFLGALTTFSTFSRSVDSSLDFFELLGYDERTGDLSSFI